MLGHQVLVADITDIVLVLDVMGVDIPIFGLS